MIEHENTQGVGAQGKILIPHGEKCTNFIVSGPKTSPTMGKSVTYVWRFDHKDMKGGGLNYDGGVLYEHQTTLDMHFCTIHVIMMMAQHDLARYFCRSTHHAPLLGAPPAAPPVPEPAAPDPSLEESSGRLNSSYTTGSVETSFAVVRPCVTNVDVAVYACAASWIVRMVRSVPRRIMRS